jgi:long-chain acyl-CoA synthetase
MTARAALRTRGDRVQLTWAEYARAVERAAGALAGLGVERGDRVALLSRNRPELAIADLAAVHLGAATVALYVASPARTIERVLRDCAPRALVVEHGLLAQLDRVGHDVPHVVSLESLGTLPAPPRFSFEQAWRSVSPDDLRDHVCPRRRSLPPRAARSRLALRRCDPSPNAGRARPCARF